MDFFYVGAVVFGAVNRDVDVGICFEMNSFIWEEVSILDVVCLFTNRCTKVVVNDHMTWTDIIMIQLMLKIDSEDSGSSLVFVEFPVCVEVSAHLTYHALW